MDSEAKFVILDVKKSMNLVNITAVNLFGILNLEPSLKSIFVAKLVVVLNFCILINNKLTPVQKFKTPIF
ncbi:MAG: hypothetical protein PWR04_598 [Anaerophaga sp.]|nr:hypothetical protein [Anaerophaga sp.]